VPQNGRNSGKIDGQDSINHQIFSEAKNMLNKTIEKQEI
jgi:hypothetical protein